MRRALVLGATGRSGGLILTRLSGSVETVAGVRNPRDAARLPEVARDTAVTVVDLDDESTLRSAAAGAEVVVNAVRLREDIPDDALIHLHERIRAAAGPSVRIVTVGGAGALRLPNGERFWQSPGFPEPTLPRGRAHAALRDHVERGGDEGPWTYLIPPPVFDPDGPATSRYQTASPSEDESWFTHCAISYADYASAVSDAVVNGDVGTFLVSGRCG